MDVIASLMKKTLVLTLLLLPGYAVICPDNCVCERSQITHMEEIVCTGLGNMTSVRDLGNTMRKLTFNVEYVDDNTTFTISSEGFFMQRDRTQKLQEFDWDFSGLANLEELTFIGKSKYIERHKNIFPSIFGRSSSFLGLPKLSWQTIFCSTLL